MPVAWGDVGTQISLAEGKALAGKGNGVLTALLHRGRSLFLLELLGRMVLPEGRNRERQVGRCEVELMLSCLKRGPFPPSIIGGSMTFLAAYVWKYLTFLDH